MIDGVLGMPQWMEASYEALKEACLHLFTFFYKKAKPTVCGRNSPFSPSLELAEMRQQNTEISLLWKMVPQGELDLVTLIRGLRNRYYCELITSFPHLLSSGDKLPPCKDLMDFWK